MSPSTDRAHDVCAWCGNDLDIGSGVEGPQVAPAPASGPATHGLCPKCMAGVLDIPKIEILAMTPEQADALPFGRIVLDDAGVVLAYNKAEESLSKTSRDGVLGKNFFKDVAPCTGSSIVSEKFFGLVNQGGGEDRVEFVFTFKHGHKLVDIQMVVSPDQRGNALLVRHTKAAGADATRAAEDELQPAARPLARRAAN